MTLRRLLAMLPALTMSMSVACFDDKDDDDDDSGDDDSAASTSWGTTGSSTAPTSTETGTDRPSVTVNWGSGAIEIDVSPRDDYWFGVIESGFEGAWTGEDCVYGYETADGTLLSYCHEVRDGEARLTYGGDPFELSAGTTVFPDASYEGQLTYFLESSGGLCFVWGADTSYYEGLGCSEL